MKIDYETLSTYAGDIKKELSNLNTLMSNIETSFKNICSITNWNSPTRDHFNEENKNLQNNDTTNFNKQSNINEYLEGVITNYRETEASMAAIVDSSF